MDKLHDQSHTHHFLTHSHKKFDNNNTFSMSPGFDLLSDIKPDTDVINEPVTELAFTPDVSPTIVTTPDVSPTLVTTPTPTLKPVVPAPPTKPGCYLYSDTGCPERKGVSLDNSGKWVGDWWGMKNRKTGESKEACEQRAKDVSKWCRVKEDSFTSHLVPAPVSQEVSNNPVSEPPTEPTEPGCYWYNETGCPSMKDKHNNKYNKPGKWIKDTWGMRERGAGESEEKCDARVKDYNGWCKTTGTTTHYVPAPVSQEVSSESTTKLPPPTKETCLDRAISQYGDKVTKRRKHLSSGGWNHVPQGCSVQSGGDWAAHWNTKDGKDDGTYSKVGVPKK